MYMNFDNKFIFMRVSKAASRSLVYALKESCNSRGRELPKEGHLGVRHLSRRFPKEWKRYKKFCFVRNPWDRHVSYFRHHRNKYDHDFDKFMKNFESERYGDYIFYDNEEVAINFIGKVEHIQRDYDLVCRMLGIPSVKVLHKGRSRYVDLRPYWEWYTEDWMIDKVREYHDSDLIAYLGYEFGDPV